MVVLVMTDEIMLLSMGHNVDCFFFLCERLWSESTAHATCMRNEFGDSAWYVVISDLHSLHVNKLMWQCH